ncbi:MAG: M36 family metallopeptidase [Hyalangium sp.]|uniref:M36 family metallopeptidase n=1 Tax=Hyalangium sp. TaxID=2028555 RepID=UPI00389A1D64
MQRGFLKRSTLVGALSLFTLSACGGLAEEAQPSADSQTAVSELRADGQPASAYGVLAASFGQPSELAAREFLRTQGARYGVQAVGDLELVRAVESPMGWHYTFQQVHRGVPVDGAEVRVHFNRAGEVVGLNNDSVPVPSLASVKPALTADQARGAARTTLGLASANPNGSATLVVSRGATPRLAYKVVEPSEDGPTWETLVDANTGEQLSNPRDLNRYATGSGRVYVGSNAVVGTHDISLRDTSTIPSTAYRTVTLQGLTGNGFLDGSYASSSSTKKRVSSSTNAFSYGHGQAGFTETMGYFHIDFAERYIQSLGFTNVNNRQQVFSANGTTQDNSWYTPNTKIITYGTGGVDDAEDSEVILHEYGHSIQDNQVPGFGSGAESGAMGEGFGDYWGASVNAQTSGGFQDTCVADWDSTSYSSSNPPCLRRLDTTKHYPESVAGEVHADGEIWSGALWNIRTSLGATRADTLILQHHFLLPTNPSFNTAANALVTAAVNLGYTSADCGTVKTHLQNRGFTVTALCP